jgi:hypothetical protein
MPSWRMHCQRVPARGYDNVDLHFQRACRGQSGVDALGRCRDDHDLTNASRCSKAGVGVELQIKHRGVLRVTAGAIAERLLRYSPNR